MKTKSSIAIIGIICFIGCIVVGFILRRFWTFEDLKNDLDSDSKELKGASKDADRIIDEVQTFTEDKITAINDIKKRHEAATSEMKDSLNNIVDSQDVNKPDNSKKINDIINKIDDLND